MFPSDVRVQAAAPNFQPSFYHSPAHVLLLFLRLSILLQIYCKDLFFKCYPNAVDFPFSTLCLSPLISIIEYWFHQISFKLPLSLLFGLLFYFLGNCSIQCPLMNATPFSCRTIGKHDSIDCDSESLHTNTPALLLLTVLRAHENNRTLLLNTSKWNCRSRSMCDAHLMHGDKTKRDIGSGLLHSLCRHFYSHNSMLLASISYTTLDLKGWGWKQIPRHVLLFLMCRVRINFIFNYLSCIN